MPNLQTAQANALRGPASGLAMPNTGGAPQMLGPPLQQGGGGPAPQMLGPPEQQGAPNASPIPGFNPQATSFTGPAMQTMPPIQQPPSPISYGGGPTPQGAGGMPGGPPQMPPQGPPGPTNAGRFLGPPQQQGRGGLGQMGQPGFDLQSYYQNMRGGMGGGGRGGQPPMMPPQAQGMDPRRAASMAARGRPTSPPGMWNGPNGPQAYNKPGDVAPVSSKFAR